VLDIRAGSLSSSPSELTALPDGRALFRASDGTSGSELWITDGTAVGTARVLDIRPGSSSSSPSGFAVLANGKAVFAANDGQVGNELWITDGTAAGTARVLDIRTGSGGSFPAEFESAMINASPVLVAPLPDTTLTRGTAFTLNFGTAFADADVAQGLETLSFSATLDGGVPLPNWLSLSAATGVLSGAAPSTAPASLLIRVAATDQSGGSASGLVTIGFRNAGGRRQFRHHGCEFHRDARRRSAGRGERVMVGRGQRRSSGQRGGFRGRHAPVRHGQLRVRPDLSDDRGECRRRQ
jgi:ELWxxDGT repeat protein